MKPTVIIVAGANGAGKTTLAKELILSRSIPHSADILDGSQSSLSKIASWHGGRLNRIMDKTLFEKIFKVTDEEEVHEEIADYHLSDAGFVAPILDLAARDVERFLKNRERESGVALVIRTED